MAGGRRKKKRSRGSSSSSVGLQEKILKSSFGMEEAGITNEQAMADSFVMLRDSVECLRKEMAEGFSKIHTDMDFLRHELKADMKILKEKVKDIERSVEFTQGEVDLLKEDVKAKDAQMTKLQQDNEELDRRMSELIKKLKEEEEKNIQLEQYTRRENLRLKNIPESDHEDCKSLVYDTIDRDLEIDTTCIRFHAVHRGGRIKPEE